MVAFLTPQNVFNTEPATGGDTGSHFYPLYALVKHGLPNLSLRVWNPGNLMGEPLLLHYFPGPYLIMAFLSLFMPLGLAFNLGTIAPLFAFPVCVMAGLKGLGYKLHTALLAALVSFVYVFNESHSMWGANAQSLLAGQFAHMYGIDFLFLLIGMIGWELRSERKYFLSSFLVMAIAVTHTYVFLLIPFFFLSFVVAFPFGLWKQRLKYLFWVGLFGFLLGLWFIVPQLLNATWTLRIPIKWAFTNVWKETVPVSLKIFAYLYGPLLLVLAFLSWKKIIAWKTLLNECAFWMIPVAASLGMFFFFPAIGLADIRAVPQIQHILVLFTAILFGMILERAKNQILWSVTILMVPLAFWWTQKNMTNYPHWVRWNYSSWTSKEKFKEVQSIVSQVKGSFSDPRMANEHHETLNEAGTPRVWELLPYFAKRSTMESLYVEATFTAPLVQWVQGRISLHPSCPARGEWVCPTLNFVGLEDPLKVLGVRDLILTTPEAFKQAESNSAFQLTAQSKNFHVYSIKEPMSLVELVKVEPIQTLSKSFKRDFMDWFYSWKKDKPTLIYSQQFSSIFKEKIAPPSIDCKPTVEVGYNIITLNTACPGFLHLLKFSYHPSWKASTADEIAPISPGFMAIVPSNNQVILRFGQSFSWWIAGMFSFLTGLLLLVHLWVEIKYPQRFAPFALFDKIFKTKT